MADLSLKKLNLLHSISSNSPFSRSHQLTFPIIRFSPLRRRSQLSHSSSSLPAGLDIVSTSEQSDGSVVFMFGNVSQNSRKFKNVDGVETESELVGASDDGHDVIVNCTNSELIGASDDGQDVNSTNSELVGASDDGHDVNCTNSELVEASDDVQDVNSTNSELVGGSDDGPDVSYTNSEPDDGQDVKCKNSELVGASDDGLDVSYTKSDLVGASDDGEDVNYTNSELVGALDDGIDVSNTNSELIGALDDEHDVNCMKSELVGALDDEQEVSYTNSELVGALVDEQEVSYMNSELVGALDDEQEVYYTISERGRASDDEQDVTRTNLELVGVLADEHEPESERGSVSDAEIAELGEIDSKEVECYSIRKDEEKHDNEVVDSTESKPEGIIGTDVRDLANGDSELEENALGSLKQARELVGSTDYRTELLSGVQSNVDCIKDEQDYGLISAMEIGTKHDGESSSITISDSTVNFVVENSNDSKMVKSERVDSLVTILDCNADMIMENLEKIPDDEFVVAVSTSQLQLDGNGLQEIAETSSRFDVSEPSASLDESELGGNGKHVGNGEDANNVMLEIAETNSVIRASEMGASLEDDELDSNLKQLENEENVDDKSQEIIDVNSLIEASDRNVKQVANEENVNGKSLEIVDMNSLIEASDSNVKQMENEKNVDDRSQEIVDMKSLIEAVDSNMKLVVSEEDSPIEALDMGVSLGDDELENNVNHLDGEEDVGNDMLELSEKEASHMSVSLNISELDCNEAHKVNEDDDLVELMEKPVQLEAEPILSDDASCDSGYNVITVESASAPSMADDLAPSVSLLSDDDISEAISLDVLDIAMPQANVDSMSSEEITTPMLYLSSAAASLPHSSENSWGQSINHVALTEGGMDAYFVCENWFGVADGVGQWSFGGTDRGRYAHELMQNCEKVALNSRTAGLTDVKDALQQIAAMTESSGAARVLIAHFANHALHVANIGDTGFVIVRNGKIFKKSSPMVHEFNFPYAMGSSVDPLEALEEYHIELEDGDVIVAATDGLFDNLYEQEIASVLSKSLGARMELKELAELLVTIAQELGRSAHGRSPFADAAQAAGHTGVVGGKLDHVTVIVSLVQTSK